MATKQKAKDRAAPAKQAPRKKVKKRNQMLRGKHNGMVLVLLEDVAHLGKQGDVVEVKPGYGRNYLVPNGLALVPTEHNLKLLERYKIKVQQAREAKIADLKVLAEQVRQVAVTIEGIATEEGHLYGSVGPAEISRALKARNLPVEPEMVRLEAPIKECALYEVKIHLGYDIDSQVQVLVVPKKQS
ncbi:MAG TPA: 50S ribosomal protein L9 [Gemmataceae bacterium]